jgi:hypothetical protein
MRACRASDAEVMAFSWDPHRGLENHNSIKHIG